MLKRIDWLSMLLLIYFCFVCGELRLIIVWFMFLFVFRLNIMLLCNLCLFIVCSSVCIVGFMCVWFCVSDVRFYISGMFVVNIVGRCGLMVNRCLL